MRCLLFATLLWSFVIQSTDGVLDTSFNGTGFVVTNFGGTSNDRAFSIALQPDGKIVAGAFSNVLGGEDFALARYLPNGALDESFNPNGFFPPFTKGLVVTNFGGAGDRVRQLIIQPDGKIVAAGITNASGTNDAALARYLTTGQRDATFTGPSGLPGIVVTNITAGLNDSYHSLVLQKNGKIVCVGVANLNMVVARYNTDGSLDTSFGSGGTGFRVTSLTGTQELLNVARQKDGKIVACGYSTATGFENILVVRYNTNGSFDTTFGTGGIVSTSVSATGLDRGRRVRIQSDGKIVVAGFTGAVGSRDFVLLRYNSNGTLDTTFGALGTGVVRTNVGGTSDRAFGMVVQPDGKIVIGGFSNVSGSTKFALARYTAKGVLDTTFGTAGTGLVNTTTIPGTNCRIRALELQSNGKIIVGGFSNPAANFNFTLARYTNDSIKTDLFAQTLKDKFLLLDLASEA